MDHEYMKPKDGKHTASGPIRTPEWQAMGPLAPPSTYENLNVKGGDFSGGPAESARALAEFAPLKTGGSSSIKSSGAVKIPSQGDRDRLNDGT